LESVEKIAPISTPLALETFKANSDNVEENVSVPVLAGLMCPQV
jgi:hypothetical protein